ncbi:hypothetical protein OAR47_03480 [Gammaproteobacteria bacterium]|nr:hypothetical protein [Gammaproteobacteria bacterium]
MFYKLRLNKNIKYSFSLLALLLLTPMDINAELTEDQKALFDILIISNPINAEYRKELFTSNIDGERILNKAKIGNDNKILLRIQNCLLTDLQSNAGGTNDALYRNINENMKHVLNVRTFYEEAAKIDRLFSSSYKILDDLLQKYYSNYEYRFECNLGRVRHNRAGANLNTGSNDFSMIPRYMLQLVNTSKSYGSDINETDIFAVIKYDELLKTNLLLAQKEKDKKNQYKQKVQNLKNLSEKKSLEYTYELLFKRSEKRFCTVTNENGESLMGHTMHLQMNNKLKGDGKFFKIYKTIENAYQGLKDKDQCSHFIDYPENIYKLHTALNRDGIYNKVGNKIESTVSKKIYVLKKGFKSIKEYNLVYALNLRKGLIRELAEFKIDSVEKYNEVQQKMLKSGYSESKRAREVIAYLGDLKEARKKGIDILKQRDQRLDNIRKNREAKAAQREKEKIRYAKEYPYKAILSCEANGSHTNIAACFSGKGKYGVDTELKFNGNVYKPYNLTQIGRENSDGLVFDLKDKFNIVAQNSNDFLVLKLVIRNRLTNKITFQDSVGYLGAIKVRN